MNNSNRFLCMYFLTISFFSHGSEEKNYRSVLYNSKVIYKPCFITYNTDKDFTIAGYGGIEIQRKNKSFNTLYASSTPYNLLKEDKKVVAFNREKLIIADLGNNVSDIIISITKEIIDCAALDAVKNTIFLGCSPRYTIYDEEIENGIVIKRCYDNTFSTYCDSHFNLYDGAKASSIVLTPKKDMLYILDTNGTISLRNTNDLALIKKCNVPPCLVCCELYPYCSDGCSPCKLIINRNTAAVYNESCIHIMDISKSFDDDPVFIELQRSEANEDTEDDVMYYKKKIKSIAFHPSGLLVALISKSYISGVSGIHNTLIKYWDIATKKEIDTTILSAMSSNNFCFRDDGLELAIASYNNCVIEPVSLQVIKQYVLPLLWMKLKIIQKEHNLSRDVLVHCMNIFTTHCSKIA